MAVFTIESEYKLRIYRQRTYQTDTLELACQMALDDPDWATAREDNDGAGVTYVSGAWDGANAAYSYAVLDVPKEYGDERETKLQEVGG